MQQPQVWLVEDEQGIADTLIYTCNWKGLPLSYSLVGCPRWKKRVSNGRMR